MSTLFSLRSGLGGGYGLLLGLSLGLSIVGCAAPPERLGPPVVPQRDTVAVRLYNEGLSYRAQSRLQDAEGAFRRALALFPKAANIRESLAQALIEQRLFVEGRKLYGEVMAAQPDKPELLTGIAASEALAGELQVALRWYQQALSGALEKGAFDRAASAARSMATIQFRLGDEGAAVCSSDLAYALRGSVDELQRHAMLLVATHRFTVASTVIETALSTGLERDPRLISLYALSRFGEGRTTDAQLLADEAQQVAPRELRAELGLLARMVWGPALPVGAISTDDTQNAPEGVLPQDAQLVWPFELLVRYQEWQRKQEGA